MGAALGPGGWGARVVGRIMWMRMSRQEVDDYFAQIPGWMKSDIRREIRLAHLTRDEATRPVLAELDLLGGGNLLAALGLVSYTEALGLVRLWNQTDPHRYGTTEECFLAFFDEMHAGAYKEWRLTWEDAHPSVSLYSALRCGLVHEYRPKVNAAFHIEEGAPLGLADERGELVFKVEPYFRHFCAEADRLYEELTVHPNPEIPPPKPQFRFRSDHEMPAIPPGLTTSPTSGPSS